MNKSFIILLLSMAITTYLIRMIPFVVFRAKIKNKFIKSFLYYIPYSVLGAMTVPYIFYATGNIYTAITGFVVALILSYKKLSLLWVAAISCLCAYLMGLII